MFGYIKQVEVEIVHEAVRPFVEGVEQGTADGGVAAQETSFSARFWNGWISLYRPDSRPTTASL